MNIPTVAGTRGLRVEPGAEELLVLETDETDADAEVVESELTKARPLEETSLEVVVVLEMELLMLEIELEVEVLFTLEPRTWGSRHIFLIRNVSGSN